MVSLPSPEDIEAGPLNDEQYVSLLRHGGSSLNPSFDWADDEHSRTTLAFGIDKVLEIEAEKDRVEKVLTVAADELYRAWDKDSNRKGLILQQGRRNELKELRSIMVNPKNAHAYRVKRGWNKQLVETYDGVIERSATEIVRRPGSEQPITKVYPLEHNWHDITLEVV